MVTKLEFDEEELVDPMAPAWRNYTKPRSLLDSWPKRVAAGLLVGFALIVLASTFSHSSTLPLNLFTSNEPTWSDFDTLFAFGDSYTSYLKSERYEDPPWKCKILSEGDRYRNKPNWITFVSEYYNKTEIRAVDFAVGGSTVDGEIIGPFLGGSSLKDEVNDFQASYGAATEVPAFNWRPEKTLFTFWFGVNDLAMTHWSQPEGQEPFKPVPLDEIFDSYMRSLNTLFDAGARNFLLLTAPPFDRSVIDISTPWHASRQLNLITTISSFNTRLYTLLSSFLANHTTAHAHIFDAHRLFVSVLDQPRAFEAMEGVTNTTGVCTEAEAERQPGPLDVAYEENVCTTGERIRSYAWTGLHATYPVHNATARQIVEDCFGGGGTGGFCV